MKSKLRPNTLAEQMKIKKFNPIELKAWNSLYPDIKFKQKKVNSKKIFNGEEKGIKIADDKPQKEPKKKVYDIIKEQKPKPHKKPKPKNPKIFQNQK
tara:strand:+ start:575 stop:865 length:291 start_codon:yes stop_codon:yes gene_type:complete